MVYDAIVCLDISPVVIGLRALDMTPLIASISTMLPEGRGR